MFSFVAQRLGQILLLRGGPQDLPTSRGLLQLAIAAFITVSVLRLQVVADLPTALGQAVLSLVLLTIYVRALLNWRQTPERFTQTMTAMLLCGVVLGALLLMPLRGLAPVLLAIAEDPEISPENLQVPALAVYAWLGLSLWSLLVAGHIYRHALGLSLGLSICVALLYEFLLIAVVSIAGQVF